MKTIYLLLLASLFCCTMISCSKDKEEPDPQPKDYTPGQIPGLGEAEGELTGTSFKLPNGVELISEIDGDGDQSGYWNSNEEYSPFTAKDGTVTTRSFAPKTRVGEKRHYFGSGTGFVDLLIPMRNTLSTPVTITFPAALILRNETGDCQNGVLIKKVTTTIPAGSDYLLCLAFYCGNMKKDAAGPGDRYTLSVVSNAKPLLDLCEKVKNKKINIEEFDPANSDDRVAYGVQCTYLQGFVWQVTDGTGLTEEGLTYIASLPQSR